jgi:hypothetical protein
MKRSSFFVFALCLAVISLILAALPAVKFLSPASAAPDPQQAVQHAWDLVRQANSYSFTAQVDQLNVPLPTPLNVGKHSQQQSARLEGTANLTERKMEFTLSSGGGSLLDPQSGTQIKIDGERAYSRKGQQAWQEIPDFTSSIAPQSDFMAFLAGAKNIRLASPTGENGLAHYTFDVNGPAFADYMESQVTQQLTAQGKLPPAAQLNLHQQFASLSGTGEIWIGADGLPVRQALHVQFPPTSQEQTQADVLVTFQDFGPLPAAAAASAGPLEQLRNVLQSHDLQDAWLFAGTLALLILALRLGLRRKRIYAAMICLLIAAMVFGPLLQSVKAAEFSQEQSDRAQQQEQRQQLAEVAQDLRTAQSPAIAPNVSPLKSALVKQASAAPAAPALGALPLNQARPPAAPAASTVDSDTDGLTDEQEQLLGTDPNLADTDGDTVSDYAEVNGFKTADGKTWYGDARNMDTNGDGIGDQREWGKDTDQDNTPDMWSFDNDSDGVPDKPDLSPFEQGSRSYDEVNPMSLAIDQLTPNTPTYVEFQVRPVNSAHLRYAFSVRDWPNNDVQGQVMDADGKTFMDVNPESDSPQDVYGDIKLIPMLEIEINGSTTNLPDSATLEGYGIFVRNLASDGSRKAVYVPLQVVKEAGDNWVAFYAKMFYLPASTWGNPHLVRLVWSVVALVDICAENGFKEGKCDEFETYNEPEIIQTYYDSFKLTGLNVREQHGTRWAVTYKDPAAITDTNKAARINQLEPLSDLVFGLDHSFLAGRLGPNGERDFPVTEIHRRFDHTSNGSVPVTPDRFGISDNILLVNEYEYPHIDLANQQLTITETREILDIYTPYWSASQPITPTILFAHEEYYRPLNLDSRGAYSNITVSEDGADYTLSLPTSVPSGSTLAPVQVITATALNWAPYIYQDGEWAGAPLEAYLEGMRGIYPPEMIHPDPAVGEGALIFLEEYYANVYQGYFSIVEEGEEKIVSPIEETDEVMAEYLETWEIYWEPFKIGMECFLEIVDLEGELEMIFNNIYVRITGNGYLKELYNLAKFEEMTWKSGAGLGVEIIAALAWLITHIPPIHEKLDESNAGAIISIAISASFVVIGAYKMISAIAKLPEPPAMMNGAKSTEFGFWGMIIVTTLLILATVGIFIYMMATNQELNGVQIGMMVANLFATIIVIIIFSIISSIPTIGPLIVALYNLINTILSEILGVNFTEMLTQQLTEIFYDVDPMTSLAPTVGATLYGFLNERGISVGNAVNISFPMEVEATQEDPQTPSEVSVYNDYYADLLDTRVTIDVDGNESKIDQDSDWHGKTLDHHFRGEDRSGSHVDWPMYRVSGDLHGQLDTIQFTEAGINQEFSYESEFDYTIHFYRCILVIFCKDKTTEGSVEEEPPALFFDVLPATVDEFYDWGWGAGSLFLPGQHDRDNDGLLARIDHGTDPDDTQWDTDGDTLSDSWEMEMAATPAAEGGFAFDPVSADTDQDGLRDNVEARLGTDPAKVDSDGDGFSDRDEANGYNFHYTASLYTLVHSSPLIGDTDGDGMDDKAEYILHIMDPIQYPYHPRVINPSPLTMQMTAGYSGYVSPGATFPFTVTVQNGTGTPIEGQLSTQLPSGFTALAPTDAPFEVLGEQSQSVFNLIQVDASQVTSKLPIATTACGALEMPLVYIPFEEHLPPFYNKATPGYYDAVSSSMFPTYIPDSIPGRVGRAIYFSNAYQHITLNQSSSDLNFSGAAPFSLSVWINAAPTERTDYFYLIAKTNKTSRSKGYNLYLTSDKAGGYNIGFNNEQKDFRYYQTLHPATWYNLIAISDGTTLKVYVDGVEVPGTQMTGVLTGPSTYPVALGSIESSTSLIYQNNFQGAMDELYIFDRTLSNQEIYSLSHPAAAADSQQANDSSAACDLSASQVITVTVDSDSPTASLISPANGSYLNGSGFQVIGGEAHDPTSFIRSVEVSVDGGPFQLASGTESWAYTWDTRGLAQGSHTVVARSTDAVGHTGLSNSAYVKIDRDPPVVTLQPEIWPLPLRPLDIKTWVQHFSGTIKDSISGASTLEILVEGDPNLPYGGWQAASVSGTSWSVDYKFPVNVVDLKPIPNPTGRYTLSLRATDNVGNTRTQSDPTPVIFDNNPPAVSLTNLSPTDTILAPQTLNGVITNTEGGGPYGLQVALVPVEQAEVTLDAALAMNLNDRSTVNGQIFLDASGFNQTGASVVNRTPVVYEPGKVDEAVRFDGVDDFIQWQEPLKTPFTSTLTAALWVKVKNIPVENTTLLSLSHAAAFYWKTAGGLTFRVTDSSGKISEAVSNKTLTDSQWHHVAGVWTGLASYIYIDGVQVAAGKTVGLGPLDTSSSLLTLGSSDQGGSAFGGWVDEVYLFPRAFTSQEVANLYNLGNMVWNWATPADNLAPATTWSYTLSAGPEGLYELKLRGMDYLGNRDEKPDALRVWQGEIDTDGPRVSLQTVNHGLTTQVRCSATDFNLSRTGYQCPCTVLPEDMVTYDQVDNWYKEVIVDKTRLFKIMSTCDVDSSSAPFQMQACDIYGVCNTASATMSTPESAPEELTALGAPQPELVSLLPVSALVDPVDHGVLTSLDPMSLTIRAEALRGLREITLSLDGSLLTSFTLPDASVTGYVSTTTWTPAADMTEGAHVFQTSALDWDGQVQAVPFTSTIYVDTLPPTVDVSPTVFTSTHLIPNWGVNLSGPVSDLAGVSSVQIALDGGGDWYPASVAGSQWSYQRMPETLPDGQVFNLDVQATDLGGHTTQVTRPIIADLVAPTPLTITLSYTNSNGALTPVFAGQTISDTLDPTIQIAWTSASDGSGLRRYWAGLSQQDPPDLASLTPVDPAGLLQISQGAGEAQAYTAYVVSEDIYGNLSWNRLGPIYTDTPLTPDLITLSQTGIYHGWMNSGESQIGFNRILLDTLPTGLSLNHAQKYYLSWDAAALRLAWLGADWDSDGDLFIYLKTGSGSGTDQAYNPYPATAGDTLTLPFAADTLVWVTGTQSARIMRWDGAAWSDALPGGLPPANFRFTAHYPASLTDLYLPFNLLGITDPAVTPLDLIAFGSQKDALRLWSVFPILNPHDSPYLSKLFYRLPDQHHLAMVNAYHWDNLALQQSPNLSRFMDVDVRGLLRTEPMGRITDSRVNSLYMMLSPYLFPSNATPLIGDGQVIHYTLYYINASGAANPAEHLLLDVTSTGPLELPGGTLITKPDGTIGYSQVLDLGPMQLGDMGSVEFTGVVNFGPTLAQYHLCLQEHPGDSAACQDLHDRISTARIDADLKTSASEAVVIDRYTAEHALVVDPPVDVAVLGAEGSSTALSPLASSASSSGLAPVAIEQALAQPPIFVRSGAITLQGTAVDPSGVAGVQVQILDPTADTTETTCQVAAPTSGKWSCAVDLGQAANESRYYARAQATNTFGYRSSWSSWRLVVVDTQPPAVSLDPASQWVLANTVLGPRGASLSGQIQDNGQVMSVDVCVNPPDQPAGSTDCQTVDLSANHILTGAWNATLPAPLGVDDVSRKLTIYGRDAAGNRSTEPIEQVFRFDTAPPRVTVATQLSTIRLPSYAAQPFPLLAGAASDGSGRVEIVVRLVSPDRGAQRTVIDVQDNEWSYIPEIGAPGVYSLALQARDAAGNLTSLGSWPLQVTGQSYYWLPVIFH